MNDVVTEREADVPEEADAAEEADVPQPLRELSNLLDQANAKTKEAMARLESVRKNVQAAEGEGTRPWWLPLSVRELIPYLLAYLGVAGYALGYRFLSGYYGVILPGYPVDYTFVPVLATPLGQPALLMLLVLSLAVYPILRMARLRPDERRRLLSTVLAVRRAEEGFEEAIAFVDRAKELAEEKFRAVALEGGPLSPEDEDWLRGRVDLYRSRLGEFSQLLHDSKMELARQRKLAGRNAPWDLRLVFKSLLTRSKLLSISVILGLAAGYSVAGWLAVYLPDIFAWLHGSLQIAGVLLAQMVLLAAFLVLFVAFWLTDSLLFPGRGSVWSRLASLVWFVAILLMLSSSVGAMWARSDLGARHPDGVRVVTQDGRTVVGFPVTTPSSQDLKIVTQCDDSQVSYAVVPMTVVSRIESLSRDDQAKLAKSLNP